MSFLIVMQYTDEQIQKMLELKESIIDKMAKHQDELDFLQKNLDVLDVVLKGSSFTKASSLPRSTETVTKEPEEEKIEAKEEKPESIQIKKNKDGEIIEIGPYEDLKDRYSDVEVIGSSSYLVMPGLVDGHSHKGLTPCQLGAMDNTLELRALHQLGSRRIDPYLDQMYCAIQMIENGTTTVQALHIGMRPAGPSRLMDTADKALKAYQEIGMRVSYAPSVGNQNMYIVGATGDESTFAATMPRDLGNRFTSFLSPQSASTEEWMSALEGVAAKYGNDRYPRIRITLAPSNVHRCSDDLLVSLKKMANKYQLSLIHI